MIRSLALLPLLSLACLTQAQVWPLTKAERTFYAETSTYADVLDFLSGLQRAGAPLSVQMIGKSTEGRNMPLAIASYPPVSSPAEARRLGKPIVYIQANIHAGEVEGKEAALMMLRRLAQAGEKGLLSKIVLLVTPIYNLDGNEKFGPGDRNRPGQNGPASVGQRANGQGFDLNRDAIKAESPETQALLKHVYNTWDPDVMMDLHTTNGTRHGYGLTYSPPLNPNTEPSVMKIARDQIIPSIRRSFGAPLLDYGNAEKRGDVVSWYTFGQEGRYCTNYVGLRNRIGILSEAFVYLPFKERVEVTDKFVMQTLEWVASHSRQVLDTTRGADAQVVKWGQDPSNAPELGVRFDFASRGKEDVLLEKAPEGTRPSGPVKDVQKVRMEIFDRFKATKTSRFPAGYFIPASETKTVELLRQHGIVVEKLLVNWRGTVDDFTITSSKAAERAFQGHKLIELTGTFSSRGAQVPEGSYLVRTAQPLGILAFHMLEPESLDGVAAWGFLGENFANGSAFPIQKVFVSPKVATEKQWR